MDAEAFVSENYERFSSGVSDVPSEHRCVRVILVTGGAGIIGANFVLEGFAESDEPVVKLDKLTYAGDQESLAGLDGDARRVSVQGDIGDRGSLAKLLEEHLPRSTVNSAAKAHVDRSIHGPKTFIETNVLGICEAPEAVRANWNALEGAERDSFRFLHLSTDVFYRSPEMDDVPIY